MSTREIPRDDWPEFLDGFSLQHAGWLVTIELLDPDLGAQTLAREIPLAGITADLRGAGKGEITIIAGRAGEDHVTHGIVEPVRVFLLQNPEGADEALEIEAPGDVRTIIQFRSAVRPEMVDGILPER